MTVLQQEFYAADIGVWVGSQRMRKKPDECKGCPLYQGGLGFVPDEVVEGADVFVLGQNPGSTEASRGKPFCGATGETMERVYFPLAGLRRGENVSIGNTIRCRIGNTNNMPDGDTWERAVDHCSKEYLRIPSGTRLIVAQGAHAWRALGGPRPLHEWRGFLMQVRGRHPRSLPGDTPEQLPDESDGVGLLPPMLGERGTCNELPPVLAVNHIADIPREPWLELAAHSDWRKVKQILAKEWPLPDPKYLVKSEYDFEVQHWVENVLHTVPFAACDAEWNKDTGRLGLIGLGYPGHTVLQIVPTKDGFDEPLLAAFRDWIGRADFPIVFHNAKADLKTFAREIGITWEHFFRLEDTMQAHHKLWCEHAHTLEYCASVYGRLRKLKHLADSNPFLYNAGDVIETAWLWIALLKEFERDKGAWKAYRDDMEVLPHADECETIGLAVDKPEADRLREEFSSRVNLSKGIAHAHAGWPINVGAPDQVKLQLYYVEGCTCGKSTKGNPCSECSGFKEKYKKKTKGTTADKDVVAEFKGSFLPFDPKQEVTPGLTLERIQQGGHPFLEARALFSASDFVVSHYLNPIRELDRVHPEINLHAQNNHRWSWVDPPMATIPDSLRDLFIPDPDWPWIEFDWDGIEVRIIACESRSKFLLECMENNYDLHSLTTCTIFGLPYPPNLCNPHYSEECEPWRREVRWMGKDDPRRVFSKTFRFRLNYGGDPKFCGDVPGARTLGLDERRLVEAGYALKKQDPDLARWWDRTAGEIRASGSSRDWNGRLRRFSTRDIEEMIRQGYDFGMQAGVQSIAVLTINQLKREFGWQIHLKYGMHDSMKLGVYHQEYNPILHRVKQVVQQPRLINGIKMPFPATFKPKRESAMKKPGCTT